MISYSRYIESIFKPYLNPLEAKKKVVLSGVLCVSLASLRLCVKKIDLTQSRKAAKKKSVFELRSLRILSVLAALREK
jgi:hypothetical protein